jgi:F-type H+-transporting ATPase subunit delta
VRSVTIARNYAEALFSLGEKSGNTDAYADLVEALAAALEASPKVEAVLMSPKIPRSVKADLLARAVSSAPKEFVLFIQAVVKRGRQLMLGEIAQEYAGLLDIKFNRVRAGITLAREPDPALKQQIIGALASAVGKEIVAGFFVDPEILGGAIVRIGERRLDGSLRQRLTRLRRQLLTR